jgi:hypothetical protein
MTPATSLETAWRGLEVVTTAAPAGGREKRILAALGAAHDRWPFMDDETLASYYRYLSENLSFPFTAYYPEPTNPREKALYECAVLGLLDPRRLAGDEIDGVFCKTQKAECEVNLPLVELEVPQDSPNSQLIEDYRHWFWNWRCR